MRMLLCHRGAAKHRGDTTTEEDTSTGSSDGEERQFGTDAPPRVPQGDVDQSAAVQPCSGFAGWRSCFDSGRAGPCPASGTASESSPQLGARFTSLGLPPAAAFTFFPRCSAQQGQICPAGVGAGALDGGGGFSLPLGDVGGCHGGDRRHAQPSPLRASSAPLACKIPPASPWVGGAHAAAVACCCTLHRAACTGETAELSGSEYPAAAGLLGHAGAGHAAAAAAMPDKACYSYSLESSRSVPVQLLTGGSHSSGAACHLGNPSQHYLPCHAYTAGCPEHLPGTMMATKAFDAEARMVSRRLQS